MTIGLWHMDENRGALAADAGPHRLDGLAGAGATIVPGVSGMARNFTGDPESYLVVPWKPELMDMGSFTIEAWIRPAAVSTGSIQTIAAQWTSEVRHSSWYFGVVGSSALTDREIARGVRIAEANPFNLVFAYVSRKPGEANETGYVLVSEKSVLPGLWSHVAASFDRGRVRLYRDRAPDLDAYEEAVVQQAESQQPSEFVPPADIQLTIGGYFDSRVPAGASSIPVSKGVAFSGDIDEVRISRGVRSDLVRPIGVQKGR